MGKVIAVFNQKGGVGKTTTNVNLSASLGTLGKKILVLDLDPQGNTTSGYGINKNEVENTIYEIMLDGLHIKEAIISTEFENVDVVPSATELSGAEIELTSKTNREYILKNSIKAVIDEYDYIFLDCPPSLGMLTINCLTAVDSVLIPIQCEYYALEGLSQVLKTVDLVKRKLNPDLELEGVVFTMYDARTNLSIEVVESVKSSLNRTIYKTIIPRNVRLAEAPSHGMSINLYDSRSTGAESYRLLAAEVMSRGEEL